MNKRILIIEDEPDIARILKYAFTKENFLVRCEDCGMSGIEAVKNFEPDVILLDVMLPDISGFEVCKNLMKYKIPILMLTARNDIVDKILGLELGADDYITKPFDIREVITRVNVALRRLERITNKEEENEKIIMGDITIIKKSREVYKKDELIKLKPKEYDLLLYMAENKNRVLSRDQILSKVWNYDFEGDWRTIDVHIRRLRQKLHCEELIETVFGIGYILKG